MHHSIYTFTGLIHLNPRRRYLTIYLFHYLKQLRDLFDCILYCRKQSAKFMLLVFKWFYHKISTGNFI